MNEEIVRTESVGVTRDDTDFAEIGRTLRKRWVPSVAVATTVFAGMALSTASKTPQYQSETLILLENEESAPVVPGMEGQASSRKDLSTEIQILRSQSLVSKAISQLDDSYSNLSVSQVVRNLSIRQAGDADVLIVSYTDTKPERAQAVLEVLGSTYVDYSLDRQQSQATNAIAFIQDQLPEAQEELDDAALAIRHFRQQYGMVDPDTYASKLVDLKQSLDEQAQQVQVSLSRTQRQYEELSRQMGQVGQNPQTALAHSILSQDSVYQKLGSQLKEIESTYALERTRFHDTHPKVENLKLQRDSVRQLLAYRTQNVLGNAVSQVDINQVSAYGAIHQDLASQLVQVRTEWEAQRSQLAKLRQHRSEVDTRFQEIPRLQQRYAELQRRVKVKSEAVNQFLQRLQELQISEAQEIAPWQILEPPYRPSKPISPDIKRGLMMALISGGLLGILAAIFLERLDSRLKHVEDAKQLAGLPLLAAIPKVEVPILRQRGHHSARNDRKKYHPSAFTEAMRSLALNLRYLVGNNTRIKTLTLTSATPAEGKTTLTYNLALALAELGQRVLLVDADMRKPSVHKLIQQPNASGLSSAIATDRPWQELVHSTETPNLDVITSGPMPPNPVALLDSPQMSRLLGEWREAYDYVLLDTTPLGGVADAQSLVPKVDTTILVTAMEGVTRSAVGRAMEILRGTGANLAGLVVNMLEESHGDRYYSYYYSYYAQSEEESANGNGHGNGHGNGNGNDLHHVDVSSRDE